MGRSLPVVGEDDRADDGQHPEHHHDDDRDDDGMEPTAGQRRLNLLLREVDHRAARVVVCLVSFEHLVFPVRPREQVFARLEGHAMALDLVRHHQHELALLRVVADDLRDEGVAHPPMPEDAAHQAPVERAPRHRRPAAEVERERVARGREVENDRPQHVRVD